MPNTTGRNIAVVVVFFITAATFAGMSLYGYTTKRDLTGFGNFLFMGLLGLVIAMLVNIFLASSALDFAISVIGVLVFTGLTAYDTQRIKSTYDELDEAGVGTKKAVMGALSLYLDFINMFLMLLRLFGTRRGLSRDELRKSSGSKRQQGAEREPRATGSIHGGDRYSSSMLPSTLCVRSMPPTVSVTLAGSA